MGEKGENREGGGDSDSSGKLATYRGADQINKYIRKKGTRFLTARKRSEI